MPFRFSPVLAVLPLLMLVAGCVSEQDAIPAPPATAPAIASAPTTAPEPVAQQLTVRDGVFTQAQVDAGQRVYDNSCKNCHDMRFYSNALGAWQDRSVLDFWYSIVGDMPADNPGSLTDAEYTDVIAYILSEIGFPAGDMTMAPNNGMDRINIVTP